MNLLSKVKILTYFAHPWIRYITRFLRVISFQKESFYKTFFSLLEEPSEVLINNKDRHNSLGSLSV
jgi:hypothetical protein